MTSTVFKVEFNREELRKWLSSLSGDSAKGLARAAEDGLFDRFFPSPEVLDICLASQRRSPIVPFAKQQILDASNPLPSVGNSKYKTVVAANVLEHFRNPYPVLRYILSIVDFGGYIVLSFPHRDLNEDANPPSRSAAAHCRVYTLDRMLLELQAAWGVNSYRIRFAKDYDDDDSTEDAIKDYEDGPLGEYESGAEAPARGGYSTILVVEKTPAHRHSYRDVEQIRIDRPADMTDASRDPAVVVYPPSFTSAGVSSNDVKQVCVLKVDHIGDFFMALPAFFKIKSMFPHASITCVCGSWNREAAESLTIFDRVICCDYYKEDEKHEGADSKNKSLRGQELGTQLSNTLFDVAIDLRVPEDARHLLQVVRANCRAGIGRTAKWPFLDVALPSLEAFEAGLDRFPEFAMLSWLPSAFSSGQRHMRVGNSLLCTPASSNSHFVHGPYADIGRGTYRAKLKLMALDAQQGDVRVQLDVSSHAITLKNTELTISANSAEYEFSFEAHVDLQAVEVRLSLADRPQRPIGFIFGGIEAELLGSSATRRKMKLGQVHLAEQMMLLLALLQGRTDAAVNSKLLQEKLGVKPTAEHEMKFIAIAPFSNSELRDWPFRYFEELCSEIVKQTNVKIVLIGAPSHREALKTIKTALGESVQKDRIKILSGATWQDVYSHLVGAVAVVTNNSGIGHIAAALGALSISIYSDSHQVIEWGARGPRSHVMQANVECGPCGFDKLPECLHGHQCMNVISPQMVLRELKILCPEVFGRDHSAPSISPVARLGRSLFARN